MARPRERAHRLEAGGVRRERRAGVGAELGGEDERRGRRRRAEVREAGGVRVVEVQDVPRGTGRRDALEQPVAGRARGDRRRLARPAAAQASQSANARRWRSVIACRRAGSRPRPRPRGAARGSPPGRCGPRRSTSAAMRARRRAAREAGRDRPRARSRSRTARPRARSRRPWGVATCSSKTSRSPARGRNSKIPPPSLWTSTIVSPSARRRAASRPPTSWASATSPISSTTGPGETAAAPNALETVPSIPFAPRLHSTRGASARTAAKVSTSRTGIDEATNSVASAGSRAPSSRATARLAEARRRASRRSPRRRARRRSRQACEPGGIGGRRVCRGGGERRRRAAGQHDVEARARVLPGRLRVEMQLRDVIAEPVEPGAQRLGGRQVAAAHDEVRAARGGKPA